MLLEREREREREILLSLNVACLMSIALQVGFLGHLRTGGMPHACSTQLLYKTHSPHIGECITMGGTLLHGITTSLPPSCPQAVLALQRVWMVPYGLRPTVPSPKERSSIHAQTVLCPLTVCMLDAVMSTSTKVCGGCTTLAVDSMIP